MTPLYITPKYLRGAGGSPGGSASVVVVEDVNATPPDPDAGVTPFDVGP